MEGAFFPSCVHCRWVSVSSSKPGNFLQDTFAEHTVVGINLLDYCPCPTVVRRIAVRFPRLVLNSVVTRLVYLSLFDPFTCVSRLCAPVNRLWAPAPAHYRRFFTLISKVYLISVRPCGSHTVHSSDLIFSPLVSTRASLKRTGTR